LNRLADEEDEINATITRLELQKKRLARDKELFQKSLELEKSIIEEGGEFDDDSQKLSDDDEDVEANDPEEKQYYFENCSSRNEEAHAPIKYDDPVLTESVPLLSHFQSFSRCIADAIVVASQEPGKPKQKEEMSKFMARQTGSKELPFFF
ncbi:unnamed protein product, partial [Allacma fusca]